MNTSKISKLKKNTEKALKREKIEVDTKQIVLQQEEKSEQDMGLKIDLCIDEEKDENSFAFNKKISGSQRNLDGYEGKKSSHTKIIKRVRENLKKRCLLVKENGKGEVKLNWEDIEELYQKTNQKSLSHFEQYKELKAEANELKKEARRAFQTYLTFDKHFDWQKIALIIKNPKLWVSQLNPTIAEAIGVLPEYLEALAENKIESEKAAKLQKEKTEAERAHIKELWDKANKMLKAGNVPPEFQFSAPQDLTPNEIIDVWIRQERLEATKSGGVKQ